MTPAGDRQADWSEIDRFVGALFRHAEPHTFVSLRAFRDDSDGVALYDHWTTLKIADGLGAIASAAWRFATDCANAGNSVVFCPPVCTFDTADKADAASLANGLAISVELDANPAAAREKIEAILGPPTVIVASGGLWTAPDTGAAHDKLHLHWRLAVPTKAKIEHPFLRECRQIATRLHRRRRHQHPAAAPDPVARPVASQKRTAARPHRQIQPRRRDRLERGARQVARRGADLCRRRR